MKIEIGQMEWFIHPNSMPYTTLGFIRTNLGGALVIGGKTGTHFTGHGEFYWNKLKEIISQGYIPVEIAKELKVISPDWTPPSLTPSEREFVENIREGKL
jgi:hypothetical protein